MLYRIAALHRKWVHEVERELSAEQFLEWCAYYDLEPWGFQAEAWCAGVMAAEVANYAGRMRKRADAKASDYIPKVAGKPRRKQTAREMKQALSRAGKSDG